MMHQLTRNPYRDYNSKVEVEEGLPKVYGNQENPKYAKMCLNMPKLSYKHAWTTGCTTRYQFG